MSCKDKISTTCGKRINSRCIDYEGNLSGCTELAGCPKHTVHEVLEDMSERITTFCETLDLSETNTGCVTVEVKTLKNLFESLYSEVCEIKDKLPDEECPSIFTQDVTCLGLDYKCLTDACGEQPKSIKDVLQLLIDNACPVE
jgi:hypothetical protein